MTFKPQKEFVDWLTTLLNQNLVDFTNKRRLRSRLFEARKRGDIPDRVTKKGELRLESEAVYLWASKQGDLREHIKEQFPDRYRGSTTVKVDGVAAEAKMGTGVAHAIPDDERAKEELIKEQDRLIQTQLRPELRRLRILEEKVRKQRAFGKKGGRPKKK